MKRNELRVVIGCILLQVVFWASYASFGAFLKPIALDTGWGVALIAAAFTLTTIVFGTGSLLAGLLTDQYGAVLVVTVCGASSVLGFFLASRAEQPWQLIVSLGVLTGIGLSGSYVPLTAHATKFVDRNHGTVVGAIVAASALGTGIGPPSAAALTEIFGWRKAYLLIALVLACAFIALIPSLRCRTGNLQTGLSGDALGRGRRVEIVTSAPSAAARGTVTLKRDRRRFATMLASSWWLHGALCGGVVAHLHAHMTFLGFGTGLASALLACIGFSGILGSIAGGLIADGAGPHRSLKWGYAILLISLVLIASASSTWALGGASVAFGIGWYAVASTLPIVVANALGMHGLGARLGYLEVVWSVGGGVGAVALALMFARFHDYATGWWLFSVMAFLALLITSRLPRTARANVAVRLDPPEMRRS